MEEKDLLPCWKCNSLAIFVYPKGNINEGLRTFPEGNKGFASCSNANCMPLGEIYTVEEWQSHPRPATREQLVEALRKIADYDTDPVCSHEWLWSTTVKNMKAIASQALEGEKRKHVRFAKAK
jgi:hypothetical protein